MQLSCTYSYPYIFKNSKVYSFLNSIFILILLIFLFISSIYQPTHCSDKVNKQPLHQPLHHVCICSVCSTGYLQSLNPKCTFPVEAARANTAFLKQYFIAGFPIWPTQLVVFWFGWYYHWHWNVFLADVDVNMFFPLLFLAKIMFIYV